MSLRLYPVVKRLLDVAGAGAGLTIAAPCLAVLALLIRLEDGGPALHRRRVLGVGGREFDALKLRTMRPDADAWLALQPELLAAYQQNVKLADDPRVTRVGRVLRKLSLDELPQLVNVLRGEMSLVGPRMIHPAEAPRYGEFLPRRLTVQPGLTGLWQVSGRQNLDYERRIELDRQYLARRSLTLDLKILALTIPTVLLRRGAH